MNKCVAGKARVQTLGQTAGHLWMASTFILQNYRYRQLKGSCNLNLGSQFQLLAKNEPMNSISNI